ncbi:MAG: outer membrane beta-barrel protein [Myxococcales bacterium]|nr:outer membrane beta-barrel protein [Myxococcales bacterium]
MNWKHVARLAPKLTLSLAFVASLLLARPARGADLFFQFSENVVHERGGRIGFKVGRFRISPYIFNEVRYDSNVFYQAKEEGTIAATIFRFLPGVVILNPDYGLFRFEFKGEGDIQVYVSSDKSAKKQTNAGGGVNLLAEFMPKRMFTIRLGEKFKRSIETENSPGGSNLNRLFNKVGIEFLFKPGGRQMEIGIGYDFILDYFEDYGDGNRFTHEARLLYTWKFYPKTALIVDVNFRYVDYWRDFQVDSMPIRASVGLKGFFTKKFAAEAFIGYGNSLHKSGPRFNLPTGRAAVYFYFTPTMFLRLEGGFGFAESLYANYYQDIYALIQFRMRLFRRVYLDAKGKYSYQRYAEFDPSLVDPTLSTQDLNRRDHFVVAQLRVDWDFLSWMGITAGYQLIVDQTGFQLTNSGNGVASTDYGGYIKHEVFGSINFKY